MSNFTILAINDNRDYCTSHTTPSGLIVKVEGTYLNVYENSKISMTIKEGILVYKDLCIHAWRPENINAIYFAAWSGEGTTVRGMVGISTYSFATLMGEGEDTKFIGVRNWQITALTTKLDQLANEEEIPRKLARIDPWKKKREEVRYAN